MELTTWLLYLAAATGLSLSPGPNGLLALTHGALYGQRRALYTIAGGALGFVTVIGLSMFGIGALLKSSIVWLTVLKWVGGAYLVLLGIQVWRAPPIDLEPSRGAAAVSGAAAAPLVEARGQAFQPRMRRCFHGLGCGFAVAGLSVPNRPCWPSVENLVRGVPA